MTRSRRIVFVAGLACLTAGLALPAIWLLNQSNQDANLADRQQSAAQSVTLEDPAVANTATNREQSDPYSSAKDSKEPAVVAKIWVPRFGANWSRLVYEGTSISKVLTPLGVGHYSGTSLPGEEGNFAIAAHRAGSGGPFRNIDKFQLGDVIIVERGGMRFTYRYLKRQVVDPAEVWVIAPKPTGIEDVSEAKSFLTLTSCTPIHINTHRYVAWFELINP